MRGALLGLCCLTLGCGGAAPEPVTPEPAVASPSPPALTLVESWPVETSLDHPGIPDAPALWPQLIGEASSSLDMLFFYGVTEEGEALEPVIAAIEAAAARGVRVRMVFDAMFHARMPEVPDALGAIEGVEVRILDFGPHAGGGVQHAKLFVVDGRAAFVGSQNFDWRSLTQIQELGLLVREPSLVGAVADVFAMDWALAGGASLEEARAVGEAREFPAVVDYGGAPARVWPTFSPEPALPEGAAWDWPRLEAMIAGARRTLRLQVMGYHLVGHGGDRWTALDDALREAAARGVDVRVMVSHWETRPGRIEDLKALHAVEGIEVRIVTIPEASRGFVPFSRTVHAKYLSVDGAASWVGTSNAAGDYFLHSRNAGFVVESEAFARDLEAFFDGTWSSEYAAPIDPARDYVAPRVAE
ncbi:MAG: phospholipase D-like domain-containing protein [Myxococcota bacterium]|nr:phospholipase D-like domain-containing protein [Myxococcota bacterium]